MSDLIDREEALTALRDTLKNGGKSKGLRPVTFEMIWAIKSLPSAERKGRWIEKEVFDNSSAVIDEWQSANCSVCNKYHTTPYMYYFDHFNFCPNCGAKMEVNE